jgi:hypothetical protein
VSASRKLYKSLAEKFKANQPHDPASPEGGMWNTLVLSTANALADDNSGFHMEKFLAASGFDKELAQTLASYR